MLTLEEAGLVLRSIKIISTFCIFPIGVDVKSGKIRREPSKIRLFIWKILYGICILHWLYMFGRLIQSTGIEPEKYFKWDHFIIHFGLTFGAAVLHFTGFCLFVSDADENGMVFNQFFAEREDPVQKIVEQLLEIQRAKGSGNENSQKQRGNRTRGKPGTGSGTRPVSTSTSTSTSAREQNEPGQSQHQNQNQNEVTAYNGKSEWEIQPGPRPLLTWPPKYSLDELLAKLGPLFGPITALGVVPILAVDPTRPQLLYSCLPPEWKNRWSFLIFLAVELLCMVILCLTASFAVGTQVLFFGKCQSDFKRMSLQLRSLGEKFQNEALGVGGRDIKREIWILRQILKDMKELVVLIELFNRCFPFCIFAWKLLSLSCCILFYFFVIRHVQDFPLLAVFLGYAAVSGTFVHTVMYSNAFSIPGKMHELKNEFLLTAQKTITISTWNANANGNGNGNGNKHLLAEMKREIKRIREVGIKVGSFHQMERESTPNFVNFVVNQVLNLLVTFPR